MNDLNASGQELHNEDVLHYLFRESRQPYIISGSLCYLVFPIQSLYVSLMFKPPQGRSDRSVSPTSPLGENDLHTYKDLVCREIGISTRESSLDYFQSLSLLQWVFDFLNTLKNETLGEKGDFLNKIGTEYRFHKDAESECFSRLQAPHYEFHVTIPPDDVFFRVDFFSFIFDKFAMFTKVPQPSRQRENPATDIRRPPLKKIEILITDAKTRRLGYFKLVAELTRKHRMIPERVFNRKFEELAEPCRRELEQYKFPSGLVKQTETGISAKPYTKLAFDLGFLNYINRVYTPGKYFKVYIQLKHELEDADAKTGRNFFELSLFEKFFFAEELLKKDYFYFSSLLEIIFVLKTAGAGELYNMFRFYILGKISNVRALQRHAHGLSLHERLVLSNLEKRIKNWKNPDVYLKRVLMPRIHWLADLSLIDIKGKNYTITEMGEKFLEGISCLYGLRAKIFSDSASHLEKHAVHILDVLRMHSNGPDNKVDIQAVEKGKIAELIRLYIDESFDHFRTLAPNRVTASQAFNYTKYKLYFKDNLKAEYSDVLEFIKKDLKEHYVVQMHPYYHDGYIQRK